MAAQIKSVQVLQANAGLITALGKANLSGWKLVTTNVAATATIYDNTSATGTPLDEIKLPTINDDKMEHWEASGGGGLRFQTGVFVVMTGAGSTLYLFYA